MNAATRQEASVIKASQLGPEHLGADITPPSGTPVRKVREISFQLHDNTLLNGRAVRVLLVGEDSSKGRDPTQVIYLPDYEYVEVADA